MNIQSMFTKPEIPVEVRIPDSLMMTLSGQGSTASRVIKLGVYALMMAENEHRAALHEMIRGVQKSSGGTRRVTIRVPVLVYDHLEQAVPDMGVNEILARIAALYEKNPETLPHV